jgi:hypothetical protein
MVPLIWPVVVCALNALAMTNMQARPPLSDVALLQAFIGSFPLRFTAEFTVPDAQAEVRCPLS